MRKHRAQGGTHRDASLPASAVKVGVLGALATATIAAPLAAAAAGVDESAAAPQAAAAPASTAQAAPEPAAPVALPVAQAATAAAEVETRTEDAASRSEERTAPAAAEGAEDEAEVESTGIEVEVPEPEPEVSEVSASAAASASSSGYIRPVGGSISSGYGYRTHPVLGSSKLHEGVDFAAACGTPVHASKAGTVVAVEYHHASGKRVKIDHGNGVITGYYHLQGFATSVGASVDAGEVIGYVGSTGRSTGCHLHFAKMDESGNYSNPMSLLR